MNNLQSGQTNDPRFSGSPSNDRATGERPFVFADRSLSLSSEPHVKHFIGLGSSVRVAASAFELEKPVLWHCAIVSPEIYPFRVTPKSALKPVERMDREAGQIQARGVAVPTGPFAQQGAVKWLPMD